MNQFGWVSLIALAGWLILALGAFRSERIGGRKATVMALAWGALFLLVALVFGAIGG